MKTHGAYSKDEAATYESDRVGEETWQLEDQYVVELLKKHPTATILDAPVGTGRFFPHYIDRSVFGVDLSGAMLEIAKERSRLVPGLKLTLAKASIEKLPTEDKSWDLVICWRLLHLLAPQQLDSCFEELSRVSRGHVCIQCYVPASLPRRTLAKLLRWVRRLSLLILGKRKLTPWSHIRSFVHTKDAILSSARKAGLRLEQESVIATYEGTLVLAMIWRASS